MNRTLSHLDALLEKRNNSGSDRLASLNRSIDSIERKLGNIDNRPSPTHPAWQQGNAAGNSTKFAELERRIQELSNGLSHQNVPSSNPLAEIIERKKHLNNSSYASPQNGDYYASHGQPDYNEQSQFNTTRTPSASNDIQDLGKRIDELRIELAGELSGINKSVTQTRETASSNEELERIAQGIRDLQQAPQYDPAAFDALHKELDDLRLSLSSSVRHEDFNNGMNDLGVRIDQLSSGISQKNSGELDEIKSRLDFLGANTANDNAADLMNRIDALARLVETQSDSRHAEQIDQRLQALSEAVEMLAVDAKSSQNDKSGFDAMEARLDEITRAIVAITVADKQQPEPENDAINRLEGQINALAQGIEAVVRKNDDEQFAQLADRIENIAGSLDAMNNNFQSVSANAPANPDYSSQIEAQLQELASRLDMNSVEKHRDDDQITQLTSRIEGLAEKFGSFTLAVENNESGLATPVTVVPDNTQIEHQLQQLTERLDTAISGTSSDQQLQNLELQIADIAAKLGASEPPAVDLGGVESRLGMIEQNIGADREATLEMVAHAAQSAVEKMGDQGFSGELISALAEDLRGLQNAANQSEAKTLQSIDGVRSALDTLVERLGTIENQLQKPAQPTPTAAVMNSNEEFKETVTGSNTVKQPINDLLAPEGPAPMPVAPASPEILGEVPSIDPIDALQESAAGIVEDNRPLEPGSGAPDIPSIVKRATEKFTDNDHGAKQDSDKTDFVAAARRAARAAVSEVKAVTPEANEKTESPSLLSKLPNLPRKPIIVAAAAVLMAVIAFAGSKILFGNDGETAVVAINPAAVENPVAPAIENETAGAAETAAPAAVREAVPYTASNNSESTKSAAEPAIANEIPANSVDSNGFQSSNAPKQTDSFTTATEQSPAMVASAPLQPNETLSAQPESAPVNPQGITSAPLPPARIGSAALRQAAATGNANAQHEVALRYTNGTGIKRNLAEAAKWYERAAAQEFAPAQYRLGSLYEKGLGVKRDLNTAMNWYSRAAEQGNARAMHNLAVISAMGANGKPDMKKALTWFTKAANFGVKDSQFNLGILYGQGMGVKQNLAESYKWFALAAKTGDSDAAKKRDEVANVMDPKALEKSRIVVRDWRPETLLKSANRVVIPEEWRGKGSTQTASASKKEMIQQTQAMLNKLGYKVGTPDGLMGPKTRGAIVKFQNKAGLQPTGTINAELVKALKGLSI